jgi:hypothetical protein
MSFRGKKINADAVEHYTRLALELGGKVTGHGWVGEPPPPVNTDEAAEERDFQNEILKVAKRNCWLSYHVYDPRKSARGLPDLILVRERVLWRELKTLAGQTTPDQDRWLEALQDAGEDAKVWRPTDWPEILATLEAPYDRNRKPAKAGTA